jgi:MoaA/NifB/PqqE/SkfB family radical SAM enzyme
MHEEWREGDLTGVLWRILARDLELAEHVHLQGWGEPLLHRSLPEWVAEARRAGCSVGLTTNGDLLGAAEDWLLRGDVAQVVISLAGDEAQHAALRDGSSLKTVLAAGGRLQRRAAEQRIPLRVLGSYLLTRETAAVLPQVVRAAAGAGLSELFVVHLDCRTSLYQVERSAFAGDALREGIATQLDQADRVARECGIRYRGPPRAAEEIIACSLDPVRFAFVGWDGRVAPCVNLLLPGVGAIPRWTADGVVEVMPVWYGGLADSRLVDLLDSPTRRRFLAPFQARRAAERRFLGTLAGGWIGRLRQLEEADQSRSAALAANPFPAGCSACPKAQGW